MRTQTGNVDEFKEAKRLGAAAISFASNTPTTIAELSGADALTEGEWMVGGSIAFHVAATTSITMLLGASSLADATVPLLDDGATVQQSSAAQVLSATVTTFPRLPLPPRRVVVAPGQTQDVFLVGASTHSVVANMAASGHIHATRVKR